MSSYRSDARPVCATCTRAADASELAPDENGNPRCRQCSAAADATALDRRAARSDAQDKTNRVLAIVTFVTVILSSMVWVYASRTRASQEASAIELASASIRASLEPVRGVVELSGLQGPACSGRELVGQAVWLVGSLPNPDQLVWESGAASSPLLHPATAEAARTSAKLATDMRYFAVLVARTDQPTFWSGDLIVVDREERHVICAATAVVVDGDRGRFYVSAQKLRASVLDALPRGLTLAN